MTTAAWLSAWWYSKTGCHHAWWVEPWSTTQPRHLTCKICGKRGRRFTG